MKRLISYTLFLIPTTVSAQHYTRTDTIPVYENGDTLRFPFAGGHNHVQLSDIDLNLDGIKDLFLFDRTGNKITTYLNGGAPGQVDYSHAPQYQTLFPQMQSWALLADYNCDGKEDIFTSSVNPAGIRVYKNVSSFSLQFALAKAFLKDMSNVFIPANTIGLPAIEDVDGDGDLDILTFSPGSWEMSYYINKSKELYSHCDSLVFQLDPPCWGHFMESGPTCSVVLSACRKKDTSLTLPEGERTNRINSSPIGEGKEEVNGSSCSLCLDMDGDGDKELVIGQGTCCQLTVLTNGGTAASASMTGFSNSFPASMPVNLKYNPCGYFLDVNNDSKRDLLVSPSMPNISVNDESIWYYENTGADNVPVFSRRTRSFLQNDMIDAGEGSDPVFFDFDSDGLQDLLVSNYVLTHDSCPGTFAYGVFAYKNVGTSTSPAFQLVSTDYANLTSQLTKTNKHLAFGDLDDDGDEDLIIGDVDGLLSYFENTAPAGNPANFVFVQDSFADNTGNFIDVGSNATPQLIDADRDGDLDLVIGERAGNLNYYVNIGTKTAPSFSVATSQFGGVDVMVPCCTGFSVPFMYDSAGAGITYHMIVGSEAGQLPPFRNGLWFYKNIENNLGGNFVLVDSMLQNLWEGPRMTVHGKDITSDGRMDLVIGNICGGIAIYLGDTLTTSVNETGCDWNISVYPNPTSDQIQVTLTGGSGRATAIEIYNVLGGKMAEQSIGVQTATIELPFSPGFYFLRIQSEKGSVTKKVVLTK